MYVKRLFICLLPLLAGLGPARADAYDHPGGLHTIRQIQLTRQHIDARQEPWLSAWTQLLGRANTGLNEPPSAVRHFDVPNYYDNPTGHYAAKEILMKDAEAAYATALAYALGAGLTTDERNRYADKTVELLNDWAYTNVSYALSNDARLVMPYTGTALVFSAELISDYAGWAQRDREQFRSWVRNVLRHAGHLIKSKPNNWADWGIMASIAADHFLDDTSTMSVDIARLKALIDSQIASDGRMPEELKRGERSLHYTHFALEPMTAAIDIVRNSGGPNLYDWTPPTKGTVKDALRFLYDNGIENPSRWPGGTQLLTPRPDGMASETFQAMGVVFGVQKWLDWVRQPVFRGGTGLAFITPTLMQPEPLTADHPLPPAAPRGLQIQVLR